MINKVQGIGINTEQQKKNWIIEWYFNNDPMGSIYLATLRNPSLVASYQTSPGMLYGTPFATGMENYFQKIKAHFGQSMFDQLLTEFAQQSNLYVDEIKVDEWHIYGSSRLGVYEANRTISKRVARDLNNDNQITNNEYVVETPEEVMYLYSSYQLERGAKRYELANHLGNVLTVISDKKTANFTGTTFTYFTVERISATDYSPFGAPLAGRTWNGGEYRYGFNGFEKDDEIKGSGNYLSWGDYGYDTRLGRRWQIDPLERKYPFQSPYSAFNLSPIIFVDPSALGGDFFAEYQINKETGKTELVITSYVDNGEKAANRLFVRDPNANKDTKNRLEHEGGYYQSEMIPTSWYGEDDFKSGLFTQSQYDKDRAEWLYGSGGEYTDKEFFERLVEDIKDNDALELGGQIIVSRISKPISGLLGLAKKINPKKEQREKAKEVRKDQPASEGYVKWKAKELEKAKGKDARRAAHDKKKTGEKDRSKEQIDKDYDIESQ